MSFFDAGAVDDRGVLLLDPDPLGLAEHLEGHVLELDAEVLGDHRAGGEDRDVLKHRLAPIAEARRLDRRDLQAAAQLVDDQRRQGFSLDVLGDDEQWLASLDNGLEDREHGLKRRELLLVDEDIGVLELGQHLLGVGDEIGREIAAIELHALDDVELGLRGLRLLDRDHALVADLLHRVGDHLADRLVAVGRDRADLGDLVGGLHFLSAAFDVFDDRRRRDIDAALEIHRIHAGGDQLEALLHDRGGQHRRGGRAVAGIVIGLRGDLAHHLRAHVLELVFEFDLLGDGDAVLGDARRAVRLVEDDIAALGTQRHLDGVVEDIDAAQHSVARVGGEAYVFGGHGFTPWFEMRGQAASGRLFLRGARALDDAHDVGLFHDQKVLAIDLDLGAGPFAEQHPVARFEFKRNQLAALVPSAGPCGDDLAFLRLFLGGVGNDDAALRLFLSFDAADDDAVVQWTEFHEFRSRFDLRCRPQARCLAFGSGLKPDVDSRRWHSLQESAKPPPEHD